MRFPEFEGQWEKTTLENLSGYVKDKVMTSSLSPNNYISTENLMQDFQGVVAASSIPLNASVTSYKTNDVLFSNIRPYLKKSWKADMNGGCSTDVFVFRHNESCLPDFLYYMIANDDFVNYVMTGAKGVKMPRGDKQQMAQYTVYLPTKPEQSKITSLLTLIDERISTQNKIIAHLESLIKGLEQTLLSNDSWCNTSLCDILVERKDKSITTNQYEVLSSTVNGLFFQRDYFSKDIASDDNAGYKIIRLDDIVLSPQNLWMGNINYNNKFPIGIVSPSYKLFSIYDLYDKFFISVLLKTYRALYLYMSISEQGASVVRRNLNMESFLELTFRVPNIDKQKQIGRTFKSFYSKIENAQQLLVSLKKQKQYLLQNLFT